MKTSFLARCVVARDPDGESHFVGLADKKEGTSVYLILRRAKFFDEQDKSLGMDTYHVEWCDEEHSGYGGIERVVLGPDALVVRFTSPMSKVLGDIEEAQVQFNLSPSRHQALSRALERIFSGTSLLELVL